MTFSKYLKEEKIKMTITSVFTYHWHHSITISSIPPKAERKLQPVSNIIYIADTQKHISYCL
jgi:hypothetical protein